MKKTNIIKSILCVSSFACTIAPITSCGGSSEQSSVKPTGITVNPTSITIKKDGQETLKASVSPADASQEVEWFSEDKSIATVTNGLVKGIKEGTTKIIVKPKGYDIPAVCVVTVTNDSPIPPEPELEQPEDFIDRRTFSLRGFSSGLYSFGTIWIIDDATPSEHNDYSYLVATNWHVIRNLGGSNATYSYSDKSLADQQGEIWGSTYTQFAEFKLCSDESKFCYTTPSPTTYYKPAIDLYVCKANFGTPTGTIKEKLDFLNNLSQINKFVDASSNLIKNKTKYCAGYPTIDTGGVNEHAEWEYHELPGAKFGTYPKEVLEDDSKNKGHAIGYPNKNQDGSEREGSEDFYYWDISPQYAYTKDVSKETTWMESGASGSLLVTEDLEVCGIYWGKVDFKGQYGEWPLFSLFNYGSQNFLNQNFTF